MQPKPEKPARSDGVLHLFDAARYSLGGARRLMQEAAFRHELLGGAVALAALAVFGAGLAECLGFVILFLILLAIEALNTAIEELVDHVSPDWAVFAKHAKDMCSFAVMCLLAANSVYVGLVLLN